MRFYSRLALLRTRPIASLTHAPLISCAQKAVDVKNGRASDKYLYADPLIPPKGAAEKAAYPGISHSPKA